MTELRRTSDRSSEHQSEEVAAAASTVAEAAFLAAERVSSAAKSAVESAASAAAAQAAASQILAAVAASRLDGLEKSFEKHEQLDFERFKNLAGWMKSTFFTLVGATGVLAFYMITHKGP